MKVSEEQFFIISRNKIPKLNHQVSRLRNAQNTQINIWLSCGTTLPLCCRCQNVDEFKIIT